MGEAAEKPAWLEEGIAFCLAKTQTNLAILTDFPERAEHGRWLQTSPEQHGWWIGGHWVGLLWLSYAASGDPAFAAAARRWGARLLPQLNDSANHDLGFLFELGYVLGNRVTGDDSLKPPALAAAAILSRRFNPRGRFIQAWGALDAAAEERGRTIIDTMMNLDLLFWASRETGKDNFAAIANAHAQTALERHIRPDGTTAHTCEFDPESGAFLRQGTHQGFSPSSFWSRGQAWAVYGFADVYRATGDEAFLHASRKLAETMASRLPVDKVPYWDFDSPDIPNDVRDSSAASIFAAGLLNLAAAEIDAAKATEARALAVATLESLWRNYTDRQSAQGSVLLHGTRSKPHGLMDHGLIYGDYYFFEALMRLRDPALAL